MKESEQDGDDWQAAVMSAISSFGKFLGKAHLTGTLDKPKWKFEYLPALNGKKNKSGTGVQLDNLLRGLFE